MRTLQGWFVTDGCDMGVERGWVLDTAISHILTDLSQLGSLFKIQDSLLVKLHVAIMSKLNIMPNREIDLCI